MDNIGLEVHKRETQICRLTATGIQERRIPTSRERLTAEFAGQPILG